MKRHLLSGVPAGHGQVGDIDGCPLRGGQQRDRRDDAQRALAADEQLLQVVPAQEESLTPMLIAHRTNLCIFLSVDPSLQIGKTGHFRGLVRYATAYRGIRRL